MEWTAHTRSTVRTAVTRTVAYAVVAAGAALVAGGVAAARTVHASAPAATPTGPISVLAALPDGIGASNRAW
jgi:hypothetical protein